MIKKLCLGALVAALAANAGQQSESVRNAKVQRAIEDIEKGRISYSRNCNWIDWGHARGDGPRELVRQAMDQKHPPLTNGAKSLVDKYIVEHKLNKNKYYPVAYFQEMQRTASGVTTVAGTYNIYLVPKGLPRAAREGIAWLIFKEVSEGFERLQGSAPYNLVPSTAASSWGIGDLMGDKIAFYKALRGTSDERINQICRPSSPAESMRVFENQDMDPPGQDKWRNVRGLDSVPKVRRGLVRTVVKDHPYAFVQR